MREGGMREGGVREGVREGGVREGVREGEGGRVLTFLILVTGPLG